MNRTRDEVPPLPKPKPAWIACKPVAPRKGVMPDRRNCRQIKGGSEKGLTGMDVLSARTKGDQFKGFRGRMWLVDLRGEFQGVKSRRKASGQDLRVSVALNMALWPWTGCYYCIHDIVKSANPAGGDVTGRPYFPSLIVENVFHASETLSAPKSSLRFAPPPPGKAGIRLVKTHHAFLDHTTRRLSRSNKWPTCSACAGPSFVKRGQTHQAITKRIMNVPTYSVVRNVALWKWETLLLLLPQTSLQASGNRRARHAPIAHWQPTAAGFAGLHRGGHGPRIAWCKGSSQLRISTYFMHPQCRDIVIGASHDESVAQQGRLAADSLRSVAQSSERIFLHLLVVRERRREREGKEVAGDRKTVPSHRGRKLAKKWQKLQRARCTLDRPPLTGPRWPSSPGRPHP